MIHPPRNHSHGSGASPFPMDTTTRTETRFASIATPDAPFALLNGENLSAFDRSIDVHVSRIRAEIEDDPNKPRRLITVRGAGYVFARSQD